MLLQERIEELESGILNIKNNQVEVIGFLSPERLNDYYEKGIQCFYSKEFYPNEDLNFNKIKDNALFILMENDKEIARYHFKLLKKETVKFKGKNDKNKIVQKSKVYKIRRCTITGKYSYSDADESLIFDSILDLRKYFYSKFNQLPYNEKFIDLKDSDNIIEFKTKEEKLNKFKEWNLITKSANEIKPLFYRGPYVKSLAECNIIGYLSKATNSNCISDKYETLVTEINGNIHKINIDHLIELQDSPLKISDLEIGKNILINDTKTFLEISCLNLSTSDILNITFDVLLNNDFEKKELSIFKTIKPGCSSTTNKILIPKDTTKDKVEITNYEIKFINNKTRISISYNPKSKRYSYKS
ncbi:MAG: hypothetical protein ACLUF8_04220 [Clostridium sp.]|jgi:hypothetical protein